MPGEIPELRDLQNRIKDKVIQYRLQARNFLTPEQIEKLGSVDEMGRQGMMSHGWGMGHLGMWE